MLAEWTGTSLGILAQSRVLQKDAQCGEKSDVIITLCGLVSMEAYHALFFLCTHAHTPTVTPCRLLQSCMSHRYVWSVCIYCTYCMFKE